MQRIGEKDLAYIAVGAAVLGAGGGGDPHMGKLMARQAVLKHGPVELISPDELEDEDLVIPSAMMGAPAVMLEKLPNGREPSFAFNALEKYLGKKARAVISIEEGGLNSCIPIYTAAVLGLPLVDADGMGRAFPELQMVSFGVGGVASTPMLLCDEKGNKVVIEAADNTWSELIARNITVVMGLSSMLAIYPMNGKQVKELAIRGTTTLAHEIGTKILDSAKSKITPVEAILKVTNGFRLFDGKITDVQRDLTGGFVRGRVKVEGIEQKRGRLCTVDFQNENLVAMVDERPVAMTPDLITLIDRENGLPITTENLRYGRRVCIIGMPCDVFWRRPEGIAHVGPRYFGYDLEYHAIEDLVKEAQK